MNLQEHLVGDETLKIRFEPSNDNERIANMLQLLILRDTSHNITLYSYLGKSEILMNF